MAVRAVVPAVAVCLLACPPLAGQGFGSLDRERGLIMLHTARKDIERHYYDTTFHGIDLAVRFDSAEKLIRAAQSNTQVFSVIAWTLFGLEDSHTLFFPPARVDRVEYGWELGMIGDSCYVIAVAPKSDAARQGLARGDQVLRVGPFVPTRRDFWKIMYWLHSISPQGVVPFVTRSPNGTQRELAVASKVIPGKGIMDLTGTDGGSDIWTLIRRAENEEREMAFQFVEIDSGALIWRMPTFDVDDRDLDRAISKANDFAGLILDLRGNSGGSERALLRLLGAFTSHTDTIGVLTRREEQEPLVVKPGKQFAGKLAVLVDSRSASAAELFAYAIQMRERGIAVGDRTWGGVMRSIAHSHQVGADRVVYYTIVVSDAAIVMDDGGRLEGGGMIPQQIVLPTAGDLADGRDPALAHALAVVGVELSPEEAGRLFPKRR